MVLNKKLGILSILFICLISLSFAIVPSTEPCWVKGTVAGDGVTVEGLTVTAYSGDTNLKSAVITDGNYSMNSVGANTGDNITLKVLGVIFDTFGFEGFCKTGDDPWVIRDFNVSKQANGTTCTSDSICTSGYCSTTCKTRPVGGGTSGGSGGTPTITPGTTVVSETTENIDYNVDAIREALEGMDDSNGNPLYAPSQINDIIGNTEDYEFTRTVLVQKIVSTDGTVSYRVTVTTTVKNKSTNDLRNVKVVIEVPKAVTTSATNITSLIPFTTIVNDPVIEFTIANLKAGEKTSIVYTATSTTNVDVNKIEFADPVIRTATIVPKDTNVPVVPDTNKPVTPDTNKPVTPTTPPMDYSLIILVIIVLLVIVGVAYFVLGKKKKEGL